MFMARAHQLPMSYERIVEQQYIVACLEGILGDVIHHTTQCIRITKADSALKGHINSCVEIKKNQSKCWLQLSQGERKA
jgi:hypothetical protein